MDKRLRTQLIGELLIMKSKDIRPNFSELSRQYGFNGSTIKKYYEDGGIKVKKRSKKSSKYDFYKDEIIEIMNKPEVKISALYQYLKNKYSNIDFTYSGLK